MHELKRAGIDKKMSRTALAVSDELYTKIENTANRLGMDKSSYMRMIAQSQVEPQEHLRDLPEPAMAYHMFEDLVAFYADGHIDAAERAHYHAHQTELSYAVERSA